ARVRGAASGGHPPLADGALGDGPVVLGGGGGRGAFAAGRLRPRLGRRRAGREGAAAAVAARVGRGGDAGDGAAVGADRPPLAAAGRAGHAAALRPAPRRALDWRGPPAGAAV